MSQAGRPSQRLSSQTGRPGKNQALDKLKLENARLMQLQSTYAITLAAMLLKVTEKAGNDVNAGDELTYWLPMSYLERVSGSDINVNAQDQEGEQGAFVSLKLLSAKTDGQEKT